MDKIQTKKPYDLEERTLQFTKDITALINKAPKSISTLRPATMRLTVERLFPVLASTSVCTINPLSSIRRHRLPALNNNESP